MKFKTKLQLTAALAVVFSAWLWSTPAQVLTNKIKNGNFLTERDKGFFLLGGASTALEIQRRSNIQVAPNIAEVAWSNFLASVTVTNAP